MKPCPVCGGELRREHTAKYCWPCFRATAALRWAAMRIVHAAVRCGILPRASDLPCADCGERAFGYDHRDYFRPLDVQPVCRPCNHRRGQAYPLKPGAIAHIDLAALERAAA